MWIGNDDNTAMNRITGGSIPAQIWRQMMITAHQTMPVRDFTWMPPPAQPDPTEVADSGAPAPDIAAATAADSKAAFYDSLSSDFDDAARNQAHAAPSDTLPPPRDDPDPHDGGPIARPAPGMEP